MKYELETIPIWDTYAEEHECPLCALATKAEEGYIDFFLGNSVMVPEMRLEVNKKGFCGPHYSKLFSSRKNRHGLGLISHTYLKERIRSGQKLEKKLEAKARGEKGDALKKLLDQYRSHLQGENKSCMICDRLDYTLRRYSYTILYLWKKDDQGFRKTYSASRGFCTEHLVLMLEMAQEVLSGKLLNQWLISTLEMQEKNLSRLDEEIFWYTQKFDFQNNDKPWGTSKDALQRTIQKLTGVIQRED